MDWPQIEMNLGNDLIPEAVERVMSRHTIDISSYILEKVKFKLGVGEAYIYDYNGKTDLYENCSNIKAALEQIEENSLIIISTYILQIQQKSSYKMTFLRN